MLEMLLKNEMPISDRLSFSTHRYSRLNKLWLNWLKYPSPSKKNMVNKYSSRIYETQMNKHWSLECMRVKQPNVDTIRYMHVNKPSLCWNDYSRPLYLSLLQFQESSISCWLGLSFSGAQVMKWYIHLRLSHAKMLFLHLLPNRRQQCWLYISLALLRYHPCLSIALAILIQALRESFLLMQIQLHLSLQPC